MSNNNSGDQTLEFKQEFLREEIMDKNYDVNEFLNYFAQYDHEHGEDLDLDYVHIDELRKIVANFQKFIDGGNTPRHKTSSVTNKSPRKSIVDNQKEPTVLDKEQIENNFANTVLNDNEEENDIEEMLLCQKIDKSPLTAIKHITVTVGQPTIIKGSLFQSNYAVYSIHCKDLESEVIRRYRDFEWFRNELKHQFPGLFVRKLL